MALFTNESNKNDTRKESSIGVFLLRTMAVMTPLTIIYCSVARWYIDTL